MTTKMYQMETVSCPSCIAKIETMLKTTEGVKETDVLFNSSRVKVSFDENTVTSEAIREKLTRLGYAVLGEK